MRSVIAKMSLRKQLKQMKKIAKALPKIKVSKGKKGKESVIALSTIFSEASSRGLIAVSKARIEKPLMAGMKRETREFLGMRDITDEISRYFISEDDNISTFFTGDLVGRDLIISGSFPGKKIILFDVKSHEWDYDALLRLEKAAVLNGEIDWVDYRPVGLSKLALNVKDVQATDIRLLLLGVILQFKDGTRKHFWMTLQPLALRVSE